VVAAGQPNRRPNENPVWQGTWSGLRTGSGQLLDERPAAAVDAIVEAAGPD
jgi:hypothetical protein